MADFSFYWYSSYFCDSATFSRVRDTKSIDLELFWNFFLDHDDVWPHSWSINQSADLQHDGESLDSLIAFPSIALTSVVKTCWRCRRDKQTSGQQHVDGGAGWVTAILQSQTSQRGHFLCSPSGPGEAGDDQNYNGCHGNRCHRQVPAFSVTVLRKRRENVSVMKTSEREVIPTTNVRGPVSARCRTEGFDSAALQQSRLKINFNLSTCSVH